MQPGFFNLNEDDIKTTMTPLNDTTVEIINGDCIDVLKKLKNNSINCCITSPPYFGLRDYGTASWIEGDPNCDHKQYLGGHGKASKKQCTSKGTQKYNYKNVCHKCGAKRVDFQLGLEPTPEEYVEKMVSVFHEVKRVLKDDGTLWLNIADSYNSSDGKHKHDAGQRGLTKSRTKIGRVPGRSLNNLKPKDLIGIPWMLAFALRSDGWYLRQDIIWKKPSPMPESVRDRCTKAHEYIFLLSKSQKYFYDAEAIKEPVTNSSRQRLTQNINAQYGSDRVPFKTNGPMKAVGTVDGRNKRSVWEVTTKPYKETHFATFPEKLIIPMVKAGCPKGGTILDPFFGAGTTGVVAKKFNRNCIGIELNKDYVKIAENRINGI